MKAVKEEVVVNDFDIATVPPLFIPDQKLPKSDQKQTKFSSKSDLNQTNFDLFPDQIQDNRFKTRVLVIRQFTQQFYLTDWHRHSYSTVFVTLI